MIELFDISTTVLYRLAILALLTLGGAASLFLAQWLKAKAAATKVEMHKELSGSQRWALDAAIEVAVQAAQQVKNTNAEKFVYAKGVALNAAQALGIQITDAELDALIESAVYDLKQLAK